jgi:hypothetical protein
MLTMISSRMINGAGGHALRGMFVLLICGLAGTFDILNSNSSLWATPVSAFPEEEEVHSKDRSLLVAVAHTSRRGGLRPSLLREEWTVVPVPAVSPGSSPRYSLAPFARQLTGAGIFQHC